MTKSKGAKVKAFLVSWVGAGIVWYVFQSLGMTNSDNTIGMLVALAVAVFVWVKLYRYYFQKWSIPIESNR